MRKIYLFILGTFLCFSLIQCTSSHSSGKTEKSLSSKNITKLGTGKIIIDGKA